jgi:tetratricopeptide (TPR) repeat protein
MKLYRLWFILLVALVLSACGGSDDRKAKYFEKAETLFDAGEFEKARLEYKNVLQIDPKDIPARYKLGLVLEKMQDYRQAVAQYKAVIDLDETHVDARIHLGQFYLLANSVELAVEEAKAALKYAPDNPDALAFRGAIKVKQQDLVGAYEDADLALKADSNNVSAITLKSVLLSKDNKNDDAISLLNKGIESHPDNMIFRNMLAEIYFKQGMHDLAIKQIEDMIQQEPEILFHRIRLSDIYTAIGDNDNAEAVIKKAVEELPEDNKIKFVFIRMLAKNKGDEAALNQLNQYIADEPENYELQFSLAKVYETQGDSEEAISLYKDIIDKEKINKDGITARMGLAGLYAKIRENDKAKVLLEEVLAENANDQSALSLRGQIALSEGDSVSAITDFRAAMRDQPNSIPLHRMLARAHMINKENDLAVDTLKRAVSINPDDLKIRADYVNLLASMGEQDAVLSQLEEMIKVAPENLSVMEGLFKLQAKRKEWEVVRKIADRMKSIHPNNAVGYYYSGLLYRENNQFKESLTEFNKAVELAPKAIQPLQQLISVYLAENQADLALTKLDEILAADNNNSFVYNFKGEVLVYQKDIGAAIESFNKAISIQPEWPLPYRNLANSYLNKKENTKAVEIYEEGIKKTNFSPLLVTELARYFELTEEPDKAIKLYEEILLKDESNILASNNLAMLLVDYRGDKDSLNRAELLVEVIKDNDNPIYMDTVGWVLYKQDKVSEALSYLEKAVQAYPDNVGLNYHLGMAYLKNGESEKARSALTIATTTETKYLGLEEAQEELKKLN